MLGWIESTQQKRIYMLGSSEQREGTCKLIDAKNNLEELDKKFKYEFWFDEDTGE